MYNEDHHEEIRGCSQCGCQCEGSCGCQCGCGTGGKMEMWKHMPKEVKVAKLEKKESILKAELDFIGKMKEMVKKMPDKKE